MSGSDNVSIDLSSYRDRVGTRVMPGRYRVIVEDAESDTAKSGNTMVNVWLRVLDGEFKDATIIDRLVLTEKSMFRLVGFMQALGLPTPRKKFTFNIRTFVGKVLEVDVEDGEPYQGRVKSEVRGYLRPTVATAQAIAGRDLDDLSGLDEFSPTEPDGGLGVESTSEPGDEELAGEIDLDEVEL